MKKLSYREAKITGAHSNVSGKRKQLERNKAAWLAQPDSRDRHRAYARALLAEGDEEELLRVLHSWMERDRLDAEPLLYFADALMRRGEREAALRQLSGVVDLEGERSALYLRLIQVFEGLEQRELSCAFRLALAESTSARPEWLARAFRCLTELERPEEAEALLSTWPREDRARVRQLAEAAALKPGAELKIEGHWNGVDLDLALVNTQGDRWSILGGRAGLWTSGAASREEETLTLPYLPAGNYRIEVSRAERQPLRNAQGRLEIRVLGKEQSLRFHLHRELWQAVGRIEVRKRTRLVSP